MVVRVYPQLIPKNGIKGAVVVDTECHLIRNF